MVALIGVFSSAAGVDAQPVARNININAMGLLIVALRSGSRTGTRVCCLCQMGVLILAKALRTIATVAGVVALVATGLGFAGVPAVFGASTTTIATVSSAVSAAASLGSQMLVKKPGAIGTVNNVTVGANMPIPYSVGRSFVGGAQMLDRGYGGTVGKVKNPYRTMVEIWSAGGPIEEIEAYLVDWLPVTFSGTSALGYYAGYLYLDTQLGDRPEADALTAPFVTPPDWSADHKLSGYAAGMRTLKFDKDGKRWSSGVPLMGAVGKWARVYDWRKDSTFPGGSGAHRFTDEDTFEWDANAALNAATYARGRFAIDGAGNQTGMVVGCGFPFDSFDWPAWTAWANVCDANGWTVNGTVYDGPGISRWENLKRICMAGGGTPCFSGGKLSVRFNSPKIALDTITTEDLADGEYIAPGMRTYRDRINTMVPRYRSEANKWEMVQSAAIPIPAFITEDGEPKEEELVLELVTDKDQAAELTAYELYNRRELSAITLPLKPRFWEYRLGEAMNIELPELGLDHLCVITALSKDVTRGVVTATFESETTAKHAFALGQTGTAPPSPTLTAHGVADGIVWDNGGSARTFAADSEAAMIALPARQGDIAIRSDETTNYIHNGGQTGTASDWTQLAKPSSVDLAIFATDAGTAEQLGSYSPADIDDIIARLVDLETP